MPIGYEYLLKRILKTNILELDTEKNPFSNYTVENVKHYKVVLDKSDNKMGVPHGGILSPLLMNWTLDGLQHHVKSAAHTKGSEDGFNSLDPAKDWKDKDLLEGKSPLISEYFAGRKEEPLSLRGGLGTGASGGGRSSGLPLFFKKKKKKGIEWYNSTWFVRFGDDFLVGVKSEIMAEHLKHSISIFLKPRGLTLSPEKTKIIP